jgi:hypothetical protein
MEALSKMTTLVIQLVLAACFLSGQNRSIHMSNDQLTGLSADLAAFIPRRDIDMVVVRLEAESWNREYDGDLEMDAGSVTFSIIEALYGNPPQTLTMQARRIADPLTRVRNTMDQWNFLPLKVGDYMIVACAPGAAPEDLWQALAAVQIGSPGAEEVAALRNAYAIEKFTGSEEEKSRMLADALESNQDILQRYALNRVAASAGRGRERAVQLLSEAIASPRTTGDSKIELGRFMSRSMFLVQECKANRGNQIVIGTLASAMVNETDRARRAAWARILAAALLMAFCENLSDENRIRSELIRSPDCPPANEVISVLSAAAASGKDGEKAIVERLLKAWQSAQA